jgi:hypothetical protein
LVLSCRCAGYLGQRGELPQERELSYFYFHLSPFFPFSVFLYYASARFFANVGYFQLAKAGPSRSLDGISQNGIFRQAAKFMGALVSYRATSSQGGLACPIRLGFL